MNPETEKNINEAIDWLQQTGGSVQDFAVEQAPLYCRELVAWELWSSGTAVAIGLVLILVAVRYLYNCRKLSWDGDEAMPDFIGLMCSGCIAMILLLFNTSPLIKAVVAPRIVIVEHLRSIK